MPGVLQKAILLLFFGILLLVGSSDAVLSWKGFKPPGNASEPRMPRPDFRWKTLWKGEWTVSVEEWLLNRSWLIHGTAAKYREWAFLLAQRTPSGVVLGKDHWLFLPETVAARTRKDLRKVARDAAKTIGQINARYLAMDMQAVVFLIPNAPKVFPERTPDWVQNEKERLAFLPFLVRQLEEQGVVVFNSREVMAQSAARGTPIFFKTDNHWSYLGAQVASEGLADFVKKQFPSQAAASGEPIYDIEWSSVDYLKGTLLRKYGFWNRSPVDKIFANPHQKPRFDLIRPAAPGAGWVGTSFSGFGSPQFFANAMGMEVKRLDRPAKGSLFSLGWGLKHFESNPAERLPLVILEIPEYHIAGVANRGAGFDNWNLGLPPWLGDGGKLTYQIGSLRGLEPDKSPSSTTSHRFLATQKTASLRLKLERPVKEIEIAISLGKLRNRAYLEVRKSAKSKQILYDDAGLLKYRFRKEKPDTQWDLRLTNLERGLLLELGELRILPLPLEAVTP